MPIKGRNARRNGEHRVLFCRDCLSLGSGSTCAAVCVIGKGDVLCHGAIYFYRIAHGAVKPLCLRIGKWAARLTERVIKIDDNHRRTGTFGINRYLEAVSAIPCTTLPSTDFNTLDVYNIRIIRACGRTAVSHGIIVIVAGGQNWHHPEIAVLSRIQRDRSKELFSSYQISVYSIWICQRIPITRFCKCCHRQHHADHQHCEEQ